jgi:hypothetical protein
MDEPNSQPRRSYPGWLVHSLILLAGLATGLALIYSLRPPKPPANQILYELFILSSDSPVTDFAAQAELKRLGVNLSSSNAPGPRIEGNVHLATGAKQRTFVMMSLSSVELFNNFQISVVGEERRDKIHTKLEFIAGKMVSSHQFDLGEEEVRVIQLDRGGKPGHRYCYVIVRAQATKPLPPGAIQLRSPARTNRRPTTLGVQDQPKP